VCNLEYGCRSDIVQLLCGVRQGGIHSPAFFSIYVNDLLIKLNWCKLGCFVKGMCFNSLLYADDIALITISISDLKKILSICSLLTILIVLI